MSDNAETRTDQSPLRTDQSKPEVAVSVDGETKFVDRVESGYVAKFDADGTEVQIEVYYDVE